MKYVTITITIAILLSACSTYDNDLQAHLKAEQDFAAHQAYLEYLYTNYDPEYVDDCLYYELECEFN